MRRIIPAGLVLAPALLAICPILAAWRALDGRAEHTAPVVIPAKAMTSRIQVTLVAVQPHVSIDDYTGEGAFRALVNRLVRRIRIEVPRSGPMLVAFPEDIGTFLLCAGDRSIVTRSPTVDAAVGALVRAHPLEIARTALAYGTGPLGALYLRRLPAIWRIYRNVFGDAARALDATVVAGSTLAPDLDGDGPAAQPLSRHVYNQSLSFDPTGREIALTRKVHVMPGFEDVLGISGSAPEWLQPLDIGPLRAATLICYDGFFPELAGRAASLGARILVQPSANPGRWEALIDDPRGGRILQRVQWFRDGLLARVDAEPRLVAGINPMLTGHILDLVFEGRSSIVARRDHTPDHSGILAIAQRPDSEEIVWKRIWIEPQAVEPARDGQERMTE